MQPAPGDLLDGGGKSVDVAKRTVSEVFEETEIRQAIQSLASQAGASVIVDDSVRGAVSAVIEKDSFELALNKILMPLGLVYRRRGDQFYIGTSEPTSHLFPMIAESVEYRPRHLSTDELQALIPEGLTQYVRVVQKRNIIVVEGPREINERVLNQMAKADQPIPQVVLEAIICVVAPDSGFRFGLDWNHVLSIEGGEVLNVGLSGLGLSAKGSSLGARDAFEDFAVTSFFLRLLAQQGYLSIRAAPRVMAKDGEKAEISIARETFFSVQPPNSQQFFFSPNIEKVEAGISLNITPVIRGDSIQVQIERAEVSEDIRTSDPSQITTNNNNFPLINRRRVATTVNVQDGQTIVIGGLMQRQVVDRESRIPVLSDIPWIGNVFRTIEKQEREAEVAIFISPRIVMPTAARPPTETPPIPMSTLHSQLKSKP
jgi:type II secretory pathway component GspD/PulD (secretin)